MKATAIVTSVLLAVPLSQRGAVPPAGTSGTASISGLVTSAGGTDPVSLALVRLSGGALPPGGIQTATDPWGRFSFAGLRAGRFDLSVSKPAYLTVVYGAKHPGGAGTRLSVGAGQHVEIAISLTRGAVIEGTVTEPTGDRAPGVSVTILQFRAGAGGRRVLSYPGNGRVRAVTDDLGRYRLYGLPAGDYTVAASPDVGGAPAGARPITQAELDWAHLQLRSPATGSIGPAVPAPRPAQTVSYSTVFYPGTADPASALTVAVAAGEERAGVDIPLELVPVARIDGTILDPRGRPPVVAQVNLILPSASSALGRARFIRPDPDGRFTVTGVPPGRYVLVARAALRGPLAANPSAAEPNTGRASAPALPLFAVEEVPVEGHDITGLQVTLQRGVTVSGRLSFEGTTPPPRDLRDVRITLAAVPVGAEVAVGSPSVQARPDGTFVIPGVAPGRYRLDAVVPPSGSAGSSAWTLKAGLLGGRNSQDVPVQIRAGDDVAGALAEFTDRPTEISGTLFDATGAPAPEFVIVAFSADRAFWFPQSWRVRQTRPDRNGRFTIAGLPPGEYYLAALTDLEPGRLYLPDFLQSLLASSCKVTLREGETLTQDLRLGDTES
jgi:Carboxypeptidase regulatory-like domain